MATLEAKLGSIPGLETVTAGDFVAGAVAPAVPSIPVESSGVIAVGGGGGGAPPPPPPPPPSGKAMDLEKRPGNGRMPVLTPSSRVSLGSLGGTGAFSPSSDNDDAMSMASSMPPAPPPAAASGGVPVRKDPTFLPYVKMLNMGVPLPAVQVKMRAEGVNPSAVEYVRCAIPGMGPGWAQFETEQRTPRNGTADTAGP